jgi:flagellar hook-associated protein 1
MSGLISSLSMAARALDAQRVGLDTAGQNIANLNTEGYVRRTAMFAEVVTGAGGVEVMGIRAERDVMMEARLRQEQPAEAREGAIANSLQVVETALGGPGRTLDSQLTAFFDSFAALSQDPTSPVARDAVVLQGSLLTRAFQDAAAALETARRAADAAIRGGVEQLNALTDEIASLNAAIGSAGAADTEALEDKQQLALQKLSQLVPVTVTARADGGVDVAAAGGRPVVIGANQYDIEIVNTPPAGLAALSLGDADITADVTSGRLGGWLQVRDTDVPQYQARLDQLAYSVATEVNALHSAGTDLDGATGQNFFTPLASATGAAAALAVDPAVAGDPRKIAASLSGAPGDNANAKALADLRDARAMAGGTTTFSESWAQLVYRVGSDSSNARAQQSTRQEIVGQIARLRDSVSGVSLDEEAASLMKFQRAYEANARFFSTIDQVLYTLLNMVGTA